MANSTAMIRSAIAPRAMVLCCLLLFTGGNASGENLPNQSDGLPAYSIREPDIEIPASVPLGKYRRIIHPFRNWTLICEENLAENKRICNVSQVIEDRQRNVVFSWSLAANNEGKPYFILRVPPTVGVGGGVVLTPVDGKQPVSVPIAECSNDVCLAYQQVGPRLREAIESEALIAIAYLERSGAKSGATTTIGLPFAGLAEALSSM